MKTGTWMRTLLVGLLAALAVLLVASFLLAQNLEWRGNARWQLLEESIGAFLAFEVAAFALLHYGLEARRLPLFIGLAYLSASISDLVSALLSQGYYAQPLVGQTVGVMGAWTAGRLLMALFLLAGLVANRHFPRAANVRAELVPATLIGVSIAFALVQLSLMVPAPGSMRDVFGGSIHKPWQLAVALLMVAAVPGYWSVYRQQGGAMLGSVLVSLVVAIFVQAYMARSTALYDGLFNLASVLKIASYIPPLIGLFVESVTLFRAQRKLTNRLEVAQAELRDYSTGLEKKVTERTRELETRAKELETFAYTVSHDLKAPLRGIQTYSQFLLDEYAAKLDETGRRYTENVGKAAANMKQFIDDLLEYSRLERREAELTPVDVRGLVESVLGERQAEIEQRNTSVEVDVPVPAVAADRAMLRQAIANLLDNAIKYSRDAKPPRIVVRGAVENGQFVFSVSDNGCGFDMKDHEKLFQIFQRLHTAAEFEGTGIGLSTVKRAIEKQGGRVWARSEPGKGATFTFAIPRREARKP
ncbi:MAG: sensor histidine kinase [Verrucomicrobiia bacterium]